ncbi:MULTISPECIES: hypothetical protein [unclassified Streptomyces]|uniref:hypothetical protein n=1 Tax=unclassified Streptomyces TaxID=2593676 RepID=UPI002E16EC54|nr:MULTISPECIES: hypothetical protein [unclassified Streptomyces]
MARGCGCGNKTTCEQVRECVQDWAPGESYAQLSTVTGLPDPGWIYVPVTLTHTTSTGGAADVVEDGQGQLQIVRPGLWEVTASIRMTAGTTSAAAVYGNIAGDDSDSWLGANIPVSSRATPYSLGVTLVSVTNVTANTPRTIAPMANRSTAAAATAEVTAVTMVLKRLAPASAARVATAGAEPPDDL